MADRNRRAGTLSFQVNGTIFDIVADVTYNLGSPKREALVGADRVHGYKEMPQVAFIEGETRDAGDLDVAQLQNFTDATITMPIANGKVIMYREAWYAADGDIGTENANIQFRFESMSAEEV